MSRFRFFFLLLLSAIGICFFLQCSRIEQNSLLRKGTLYDHTTDYSVSLIEAEEELTLFLSEISPVTRASVKRTIVRRRVLESPSTRAEEEPIIMYVFDFDNDKGYAIMAGDRRVPSPMCFVETGTFGDESPDCDLDEFIMSELTGMYQEARQQPDSLKYEVSPLPEDFIPTRSDTFFPVDTVYENGKYVVYYNWVQAADPVGTILSTQWSQSAPFNDYCPLYMEHDSLMYRSAVGCLPVAVGQIMAFWKVPFTGTQYDFFDWEHIGPILNRNSTPMNHVGWAMLKTFLVRLGDSDNLDADYGRSTSASPSRVGITFENFGYSQGGAFQDYRLDSLHHALYVGPVLGMGFSKMYYYLDGSITYGSGHAWVFDQSYNRKHPVMVYDSNWNYLHGYMVGSTLLHINWGWGGWNDGYYAPGHFKIGTGVENPLSYSRPSINTPTKTIIDTVGTYNYYQFYLKINTCIRP